VPLGLPRNWSPNAVVTAAGTSGAYCNIQRWGGLETTVDVGCYNARTGLPEDSAFLLSANTWYWVEY
jgi:hypothetical protein